MPRHVRRRPHQHAMQRASLFAFAITGAVCFSPLFSAHAAGINVGADTGVNVGVGTNSDVTVGGTRVLRPNATQLHIDNDARIGAIGNPIQTRTDFNGDGVIDSRDSATINNENRSGSAARSEGNLRADSNVNTDTRLNNNATPTLRRSDIRSNLRSDLKATGSTNKAGAGAGVSGSAGASGSIGGNR